MSRPSLARRWVRFADAHRRAILLVGALLAGLGLWGTVRLFADLRPDLAELLPANSRSARDLDTITRRVGGFAEASIILSGADPMTLALFADDLAGKLEEAPKDLVRWVEYRVDEVTDFYRPRVLLFASREELTGLLSVLRARIAWEEASARGKATGPAPDVEGRLEALKAGRKDLLGRFPDGYVMGTVPGRKAGETITALAMLVRMGGDPGEYARVVALDRLLKKAVADLAPAKYAPGLQVAYGGYVASNMMEHDALAEDLVWATLAVILAVALAIAVYNRTWRAVPAIGIPLFAGTFATFGVAELAIGHLNSNTAFLGSIVIGNGINVGLIFFARYLEERRRGRPAPEAMEVAVETTWLATLTAALAAGVAYGSLLSTDFRGFNQFGLIGLVGMAFSWLFAYGLTPSLTLAWEARRPMVQPGERPARPVFTHLVSLAVEHRPRTTAIVAVALSLASVALVVRFANDPIEYDFRKLRDQAALVEGGPAWWDARVDAIFGQHLTPTVLLARDEAEARRVGEALEAHRQATPATTLGSVLSVAGFVPEGQAEKLPLLRELRALATPAHLAFLPFEQQQLVRAVLPPVDLKPFGVVDLPPSVRRQLTEVDGRVGTPVLVYPAAAMDVWDGRDVIRYADELRSIELPRADLPQASSMLVFADVLAAIRQDGPRATALSLLGVVALVLVAFGAGRHGGGGGLRDAGWVLVSLGLGVLWFGGLAGALQLRLNMLNFIALPITFGIGVDYAVNVFQRRRLDHTASIADCVRTTGGAVALCSLTTIIGYSSLLIARNQALNSFGLLADLGEVACLTASLFALPAFLRWRELSRRPPA
jgi:predicted RND superfamily exporter protein